MPWGLETVRISLMLLLAKSFIVGSLFEKGLFGKTKFQFYKKEAFEKRTKNKINTTVVVAKVSLTRARKELNKYFLCLLCSCLQLPNKAPCFMLAELVDLFVI